MGKDIKSKNNRNILRLFVLLIISLLICAPPAISQNVYADIPTAQISSQNQTVHRGQTFDVDVNLSGNTGLLTLFLTIKFDHNVFKLINVQQTKQALSELNMEHSGSGYDYVDEKTGGFNLFWDGGKADSTNGNIVKLTFQSSMTAEIGTYPIDIVVDNENTTISYNVEADICATSPQITLIEGAYIVVWRDWNGESIKNTNISNHPYNQMTGGYEYNSEDGLNFETDFPDSPSRVEDAMFSYEFAGWEGCVWTGDVPNDSSVICYVAKYTSIPKIYIVSYYVDGYGEENIPDGRIVEEELYTMKATAYNSTIDDRVLPYKEKYSFYGWYADANFTNRLITPLMPAKDLRLYGYFKYNIREEDVPFIELVYRETITNGELENIAYVDVNITKNYGLSSLMITLASFDTESLEFCGFQRGEIFNQMSLYTTDYEGNCYPENFNFSWNQSYNNSYEIGRLLVLKFKLKPNATPGAYEVVMTSDNHNTTYVNNGEIWYSNVEFSSTKIPIGRTNHWEKSIAETETGVEVNSSVYVPYNIELVVQVISNQVETIIDSKSFREVLNGNMTVHSLFDICFMQNATRLTQEQYAHFFGEESVVVKIKLTPFQISCKKLDVYYVDDDGKMHLYESTIEKGYLVFRTNHFSNWALVGDNAIVSYETTSIKLLRIMLVLFGISASALIAIAFVRNRKKQALVVYQNTRKEIKRIENEFIR